MASTLSFPWLQSMDVLHRNINEALRLHPPLVMLLRYAKQPFTVTTSTGKEYLIPKVGVVKQTGLGPHLCVGAAGFSVLSFLTLGQGPSGQARP